MITKETIKKSSSFVLLLLFPHLFTHISLFPSFLSTLACSVFQSRPLLSDFAQTRLALGKGSPESALSTPGSPHHEYIMIPPVSIRLPRQHFLSQRPLKMASLPHFWSSIRRQTVLQFFCGHFNSICMLSCGLCFFICRLGSFHQKTCFVHNLFFIVLFAARV